ncbi:hypothetical protein ACOMHN_059220 [Nucella lapillus]
MGGGGGGGGWEEEEVVDGRRRWWWMGGGGDGGGWEEEEEVVDGRRRRRWWMGGGGGGGWEEEVVVDGRRRWWWMGGGGGGGWEEEVVVDGRRRRRWWMGGGGGGGGWEEEEEEASLPFAIKAAGIPTAAVMPSSAYGYHATQYLYPSYMAATQGVLATLPSALSPTATTAGSAQAAATAQYAIDYAPTYPSQFATTSGYEAYAPYTTTANPSGYAALPATAYTYAMPQHLTASGASHFAHFQSQQIPERLQ